MQPIATFSIVAYDPGRQEWGVAVQSKFLAVGALLFLVDILFVPYDFWHKRVDALEGGGR